MLFPTSTRKTVGGVSGMLALAASFLAPTVASASEADLVIPPLGAVNVTLLLIGMAVCVAGILWGYKIFVELRNRPVHGSMRDISELIYETCKTYLFTQGRFIAILWVFIGAVMIYYFGFLAERTLPDGTKGRFGFFEVALILFFSLVGIAGSYGVAWFGIRVNTFANSRAAFGALTGKPWPCYYVPLQAGISIGTVLICVELLLMLFVLIFMPASLAGACFIGFAIGESLGASALRIAGGIFTKIADIGSDLMKIVFKIKEDDARNPGVIADCTGDNAGDSVGPTADGFETYGVTGVAMIAFILLAIPNVDFQRAMLVWIFMLRVLMVITSIGAYFLNNMWAEQRFKQADKFNFETPLTSLVFITSGVSIVATYILTFFLIGSMSGTHPYLWFKLATIVSCGTIAGALIPELVKVFTSMHSGHVREVLTASKQGGASLNILSGLTAGNFSCFWIGGAITLLMAIGNYVAEQGLEALVISPQAVPVFAFGLIAFGFLSMGPVTIAVDSYGPVTDNAQSVYELSTIEEIPNISEEIRSQYGFEPQFDKAKHFLEENDGAGNTFKATAKPVLIGTAVVGATTLIFSIIVMLTEKFTNQAAITSLSILNAHFLLGLLLGGAVIYWFTGASTQAVITGAYRAVEFIKANIRLDLDGPKKANVEDSKRVVQICTEYAQKGMFTIFLTVFFATLAFAFAGNALFIGYLISIAIFGLYQAIFMANAGGSWDNAKKLVEVELHEKGTELHAATVVGDTVGDPFKDTSSVAMNPVIKFTTLFGLLALEVAVEMDKHAVEVARKLDPATTVTGSTGRTWLFLICLAVTLVCVWWSFYKMRIVEEKPA
jgi:K(+)-stimulated pyrophosphate-energized sodium pump